MFTILAQTGDTATTPAGSGLISFAIMALGLGGVFYFLFIRPQRTRAQRHEALVSQLVVGDEVQTIGGIYGRIEFMDDKTVVLQVEGGSRLRVARRALAGKTTE